MTFIAAGLTMCAAEDSIFLKRWLDHYAKHLGGREHLYVFVDGRAPQLVELARGASVIEFPRDNTSAAFEKQRWWILQRFCEVLATKYNAVICGDVDELIVPAPGVATSVSDYLSGVTDAPDHLCPIGFEIIHLPQETAELDASRPVLQQRHFGRLNSKYAKPSILMNPYARKLKPGGHIWHNGDWNLTTDLCLFHLKAMDRNTSQDIAKHRMQRVSELEGDGATVKEHGIRGWQQGFQQFEEMQMWMMERMEKLETLNLGTIGPFLDGYERRRNKIKRCPSIQTGPFQLDAEWWPLL